MDKDDEMTTKHTEREELIRFLLDNACGGSYFNQQMERIADLLADSDPNAPWLTQAHMLCADHGIPTGNIAERIKKLRERLAEDKGDERVAELERVLDMAHEALSSCITKTEERWSDRSGWHNVEVQEYDVKLVAAATTATRNKEQPK